MNDHYDVVVVGGGPAGLACADRITKRSPGTRVLICEQGRSLGRRPCPVDRGFRCTGCGGTCNVLSGIGGCIQNGDGAKLSLLPAGKRLYELFGKNRAEDLCRQAREIVEESLGRPLQFAGQGFSEVAEGQFFAESVRLVDYPVSVLTERDVSRWLTEWHRQIASAAEISSQTRVTSLGPTDTGFVLTCLVDGSITTIDATVVVIATGRAGLSWTARELAKIGVELQRATPSIGVRFEMSAGVLEVGGIHHPDLKASLIASTGRKAKSFCFCGGLNGGRIKFTHYQDNFEFDVVLLDGHVTSNRSSSTRGLAGNFGMLTQVPEGSDRATQFLEEYARVYGGRPLVENLASFRSASPLSVDTECLLQSVPFEPTVRDLQVGPLHRLFTEHERDALEAGFEMIVGNLGPASRSHLDESDVLVIGPEVEFLWDRPRTDDSGKLPGLPLWVVGDAAGIAQGIVQSMMAGLAAGDAICAV